MKKLAILFSIFAFSISNMTMAENAQITPKYQKSIKNSSAVKDRHNSYKKRQLERLNKKSAKLKKLDEKRALKKTNEKNTSNTFHKKSAL